jgi:hypothetical protein
MIKPFAGKLRGVRVMPDPLGILLNPFEENGVTYGYVIVQNEESPAVFDGAEWHSIMDDDSFWEISLNDMFTNQMSKILESVELDPAYERIHNLFSVGA